MSINKHMHAQPFSVASSMARFAAIAALGILGLAGCSGGSGTAENPVTDGPNAGPTYTGPAPATTDIQAFRVNFWENIRGTDRCGSCHNAGGQSPQFARSDDVNQAYQQANGVVNRENPSLSLIVTKVGGGHNCWRGDPGACASDLTRWISAWVGASGTGGRQIQLTEPTPRDPGSSRRFDATPPTSFYTDMGATRSTYTLLRTYCAGCHQASAPTAQSPYFAAPIPSDPPGQTVPQEAFTAAVPKINLDTPADSRLVVRLARESHNCWSTCSDDAADMQAAIQLMTNQIQPRVVDASLTVSKALTLYDGTLASGGNRYENNLIALYEFKTGQGAVAFDTSGVAPAADLNLSGTDVSWVGGYGINIRSGKAQASTTSSRKLHQLITATGEYSIEAWVVPGNVTQEDARIVSYSGSTTTRNFTLGQQLYNYEFFGRSSETDGNGETKMSTDDDAERLQASLQHVVMTFDPVNGRRIYVNGEFTGDVDPAGGGTLEAWDNSFAFVLGNETSGDRQWQGVVRLVAIHNRALNLQQIQQNFEAGVGQKFFLLFGISHLIDVPKAYVMFETTQYDSFGYLFTNPKFISLDPAAMPGNVRLKGMRIGLNGAEPPVGQAYRLLDTALNDAQYSATTGQTLSTVGTIVPLEQGPEADEFFLCFDELGGRVNACSNYAAGVRPQPENPPAVSDIGVKLFDAINATMASITGVSPNDADVKETYDNVRQSLPAVHDIQGYLSSHQTSVAQLALQYCNKLVDNTTLGSQFFTGVNFGAQLVDPNPTRARAANEDNSSYADAYNLVANGTTLINVLHNRMVGTATTQPDVAELQADVGKLVKMLCVADLGGETCGDTRTVEVVKAACGATLGSAATLVQ